MRVIIREDYEKACEWVAQYVRKRIHDFNPTAKRPFVLGLPTGSTPIGIYKRFVQMHKAGQLSFKHVITFNMDEYVGLPKDHDQSYHSFMWSHLFKHIDILPENAHILNGNAKDLEKECTDYEDAIKRVGGIELFLGGVGHDGHVAFNEPGSSLMSRTRVKTLAYETIVANARFFENDIKKVPNMALTVGVGTIMDAREVLIVVTGTSKAAALAKCMEEGVNHMYTMSAIQMHVKSCIVCDEDATGELRVRTVKYFKGLEQVHQQLIKKPLAGHLTAADEAGERHEKKLKISVTDSAPTAAAGAGAGAGAAAAASAPAAAAAAAPAKPAAAAAAAAAAAPEAQVPTPSSGKRKNARPKSAGGKKVASGVAAVASAVPQSPFPASPGVGSAEAAAIAADAAAPDSASPKKVKAAAAAAGGKKRKAK